MGQREATWERSLLTVKVEDGYEPGHAVGSGRGSGPQFRASRRMETFIQILKKRNSGPNPNYSERDSPLDPPDRTPACGHLAFFSVRSRVHFGPKEW